MKGKPTPRRQLLVPLVWVALAHSAFAQADLNSLEPPAVQENATPVQVHGNVPEPAGTKETSHAPAGIPETGVLTIGLLGIFLILRNRNRT